MSLLRIKIPILLLLPACSIYALLSQSNVLSSSKQKSPNRLYFPIYPNIPHPGASRRWMSPFGEETLPNFLGINPIEATIIGGVLYYVYGPTVLYEYAREAGKIVSTYLPVVKSVSMDIYYEMRDYLEEDREREALRKQGVDISNIPRRTTNIIERVQESLATLDEAMKGGAGETVGGSSLEEVYGGDVGEETLRDVGGRRRSKKEVLLERGAVDPEIVMKMGDGDDSLQKDAAMVRERVAALQSKGAPSVSEYGLPDVGAFGFGGAGSDLGAAIGASKFQQQLSGQWNQRVLRRGEADSADASSDTVWEDAPNAPIYDMPAELGASYPLTTVEVSPQSLVEVSPQSLVEVSPQSSVDASPQSSVDASPQSSVDASPRSNASVQLAMDVDEVLSEIDRDYVALRSRLVALIQSVKAATPIASTKDEIDDNNIAAVDGFQGSEGRRLYWPPSSTNKG